MSTETLASAESAAPSWRSALSPEERRDLLRTNDWRGALSIALNWGIVAGAMAAVAISSGWALLVTIPLALALIGGRQLGFAVLMHEAAHHTLFRSRWLNDWAGNWLCAFPIWADVRPYRRYHLRHHSRNWTDEDRTIVAPDGTEQLVAARSSAVSRNF